MIKGLNISISIKTLFFLVLISLWSYAYGFRKPRTGRITQALQGTPLIKPFENIPTQPMLLAKSDIDVSQIKEKPFKTKADIAAEPEVVTAPIELKKEIIPAHEALKKIEPHPEEPEKIELQFEDADLQNFVKHIEELFNITFIADDAIEPLKQGAKTIKGNKISFKTNVPLAKAEVWNLFLTFMDIAGFTIIKQTDPTIYRIQPLEAARKSPITAFIGVPYETLPSNDEIIRYVYFIENSTLEAIEGIVRALKSTDAPLILLREHKAFILTDKSYNIKALMKIVKELDKVSMPQAMSVLKLRQADAQQVKQLYDTLAQTGEQPTAQRPVITRKQPTALYFPENTRIIAEPRTNSLILLGTKDAIKKIEDFIVKYVDIELDQPYSPLHIYQLKYADAAVIADIMTNTAQYGQNTPAGKSGGVRGEDKYLRQMTFTPEKATNRLIIKGDYNDYLAAREIIKKLDEQQPQVAIEVIILTVNLDKNRELGAQIRSKVPGPDGLLGPNVKFQTSGLRAGLTPQGIVQNFTDPGVNRLLGNLLNLVTQATPGNTIISLGQDMFGVWGILQLLDTVSNLQVVSNPFIIATNKTPSTVAVGETRRVIQGMVTATGATTQNTFGDDQALLTVTITPQINSDGMIILKLVVDLTQFTNPNDPNSLLSAEKTTKRVETQAIVADKEVLALGGLIKNTINNSVSKVPILGDIPVIGWLFKNRAKVESKANLLILISTRIIEPEKTADVNRFTQERIRDYHGTIADQELAGTKRDPIHRLFFAQTDKTEKVLDDFIFKPRTRKGRKRRKGAPQANNSPQKEEQLAAQQKPAEQQSNNQSNTLIAEKVPQETTTVASQETNNNRGSTRRRFGSLINFFNQSEPKGQA